MLDHNKTYNLFVLFLSLLVFSCATTHAPYRWLESAGDLKTDAHGSWIYLQTKTNAKFAGELISMSSDSIFVANEKFHALARSDIKTARLVAYKSDAGVMGGLVLLGTLSTISNGILLIFTAPMWIIGGSVATGVRSYEPIIDYPKQKWSAFVRFARYPQGLPLGIDRSQIKMKPRA